MNYFGLRPICGKLPFNVNKKLRDGIHNLCEVRLRKIDWEENIPLIKLKKYLQRKRVLTLKKYTIKLDRIKLIWNGDKIRVKNVTIKI